MRLSPKNFRFRRHPNERDARTNPEPLNQTDVLLDAREQLARAARIRRAPARAEALLAVAKRFATLPASTRNEFARVAGLELTGIVEKLSNSATTADRKAAAACISLRPHSLLFPLLATLIRDPAAEVRAEADNALLAIANALLQSPQPPQDPELLQAFDRCLADAVRDYPDHRLKGVLDAALLHAPHPGPALKAILTDASQPAHLPLRAALRKADDPQALSAALALLVNPSLSSAAAEALSRPSHTADPAAVWVQWPLLAHPARRRHLRTAFARASTQSELPPALTLTSLPDDARLGAVRWARETCRHEDRLVAFLADFLADPSPHVRLAVVHAIAPSARTPSANALLRDFSFDADPQVAQAATIALAAPRTQTPLQWSDALARSPHPLIRHAAPAFALASADPLRSPVAARAALARDHASTLDLIRREISAGSRRLAAVQTARRLGLARQTELELLAAASEPGDHRLVASAAIALADAGTPSALHAVSRLVGHPDPRVRANALEAVAGLDPASPLIEPKLLDAHPRTRANAILAALRDPPQRARAIEALLASLSDDRANMRVSALWAVERAAPPEAANHVAALASDAPQGAERTRARRAARRLLATMRDAPKLRLTA